MAEVWYSHFETDDGLARQCRECGVTNWPASPDPERSAPIDHDPTCAVGAAERAEARVSFMWGRLEALEDESRLRHERALKAEAERDVLREAADRMAETMLDAVDCLRRTLEDPRRPFTLDQRAEVMLAIEALTRALAAARGPAGSGEGA